MKYQAHYDRLIARARERVLDGYKERHHIVPRCMGGDDSPSNLVYLTAEEHYVAHKLLVHMHPAVHKLLVAAVRMTPKDQQRNKAYGWLRRALSESMLGKRRDPAIVAKIAARLRGRTTPPEHRAAISATLTGRKKSATHAANLRAHLSRLATSPQVAAKRAAAARGNTYMLGKKKTPEGIERTAAAHRGKVVSAETREKLAALHRGKPLSLEHRAKVSASLMGNTRTLGKKASPETRAKMSASRFGKKRGPYLRPSAAQ